MQKRNVTLSMPTDLIRRAKALAAARDKSLSELLRESLEEKVSEASGYRQAKHAIAVRILEDLWKSGNGILSTQILQEFFVNVTKKIPKPLSVAVGREIVEDFLKK